MLSILLSIELDPGPGTTKHVTREVELEKNKAKKVYMKTENRKQKKTKQKKK